MASEYAISFQAATTGSDGTKVGGRGLSGGVALGFWGCEPVWGRRGSIIQRALLPKKKSGGQSCSSGLCRQRLCESCSRTSGGFHSTVCKLKLLAAAAVAVAGIGPLGTRDGLVSFRFSLSRLLTLALFTLQPPPSV